MVIRYKNKDKNWIYDGNKDENENKYRSKCKYDNSNN